MVTAARVVRPEQAAMAVSAALVELVATVVMAVLAVMQLRWGLPGLTVLSILL